MEPRRQFDFWLGEWNVFVPSGDQAGQNHIELSMNGNLLIERYGFYVRVNRIRKDCCPDCGAHIDGIGMSWAS